MKNKITKVKGLLIAGLLLISLNISAQEILQPSNEKSYTEYVDKILQDIKLNDVNNIKNGVLYDRVFPIAKLETFNDSTNISNYEHFMQSWNELSKADINKNIKEVEIIDKIAYHYEKQNIIEIGLINTDFTIIDTTSLKTGASKKLELVNNKIQRIPNKNPYITKHSLVIAPLNKDKLNGTSINFEFGKIVINNSDKKIATLIAHFENNQNFTLIENSISVLNNFNVTFQNSGVKEIIFDIIYTDNSSQTTYSNFQINTSLIANRTTTSSISEKRFIKATKPFQGYDEPNDCNGDCFGEGEYKVYFASGNTEITKPFIIVDGFDPGDKRKIDGDEAIDSDDEHLYSMMFYNKDNDNLIWDLNTEGYDVIILNFPKYKIGTELLDIWDYWHDDPDDWNPVDYYDTEEINIYRDGGADYVERNAKVLEALINEINVTISGNTTIKVAGPSMGALIVQYALAEMEEDNEIHNVDLFVSFDGPHKGANISIGMQKALDYFDVYSALNALRTPAAKQMLINHFAAYSEGLPQGAPNFRNRFQNELNRIGFPQQSKNVAVINGSLIGEEKSITDGEFVYAKLSTAGAFLKRSLWINYTKNSGQKVVFRYLKKNWYGLHTQADIKKRSSSSSSFGSLDNASGGYLDIKGRIEKAADNDFPMTNLGSFFSQFNFEGIEYDNGKKDVSWLQSLGINALLTLTGTNFYIDMNEDFCFVPTKSSLAFSGSNNLWRECLGSRNLVCTGETPFDSYYAPTENQEHADLHREGITWLLSAVNAIDNDLELPSPSTYNSCNRISSTENTIQGSNKLCVNETSTFRFESSEQCNNNINWSTSNNLQIINSNNDEITVKAISSVGNKWIKVLSNGNTFTKHIIGKPSFTSQQSTSSHTPSIQLLNDWIDLDLQDVISITWLQTGGNGILHGFNNSSYAFATGNGNYWYVSGQVQVTNSCGTTTRNFGLAPFMYIRPCDDGNPNNDFYIQKTNANKYRIINPCQNYIQNINTSELYNIYGIKTHDITPNQDKIEFNGVVNPGEVKVIKTIINGKVLSKTIITD